MNNIVTQKEIESFKEDGAIFLKNRFDIEWIKKLKLGIKKAKNNPITKKIEKYSKVSDHPYLTKDILVNNGETK